MISSRAKCANLLLNLWYMDDGIIAGPARDVRKALRLIAKYGPDLGLNLNLSKCELFCSSVETLEQHDFWFIYFKRRVTTLRGDKCT